MAYSPSPGTGDLIDIDPQFADVTNNDFSLLASSPAIASGFGGFDRGAVWFTNRPQAVSGFDLVQPDQNSIQLNWQNPEKMLDGTTISGTLSCQIVRNGLPIANLASVQPGDSLTFSDSLHTPGYYQYSIGVTDASGNQSLLKRSARCWAGGDLAGIIIWALDNDSSSVNAFSNAMQELPYNKHVFITDDPHEYELNSNIEAVFVLLGAQPDYYFMGEGASNRLIPYLLNGGNVYLEGGDFWADTGQQGLAVHQFFHVDVIGQGAADLSQLSGVTNTLFNGLQFSYSGTGNSLDDIANLSDSEIILYNPADGFGGAVAYSDQNYGYKTIGASFRFGNLQNGTFPHTRTEYLQRVMDFFFPVSNILSEQSQISQSFEVFANYPNPFNGSTTIKFRISEPGKVRFELFNILGQQIYSEILGEFQPGDNTKRVHLTSLNSGVYFYKLYFEYANRHKSSQIKKLILLK